MNARGCAAGCRELSLAKRRAAGGRHTRGSAQPSAYDSANRAKTKENSNNAKLPFLVDDPAVDLAAVHALSAWIALR